MPEHTIAENLTRLQNATTAIGNAITAKGGTVSSGDGLEDFASDIATIPSGGENNAKFGKQMNTAYFSMGNIESIVIPEGCAGISSAVFRNCNWLTSVTLPSTIESIASESFKNCVSLTSIEIPSSVTSINYNAFAGCANLLTITVHKPEGSISDAPWGATNATVVWDG